MQWQTSSFGHKTRLTWSLYHQRMQPGWRCSATTLRPPSWSVKLGLTYSDFFSCVSLSEIVSLWRWWPIFSHGIKIWCTDRSGNLIFVVYFLKLYLGSLHCVWTCLLKIQINHFNNDLILINFVISEHIQEHHLQNQSKRKYKVNRFQTSKTKIIVYS